MVGRGRAGLRRPLGSDGGRSCLRHPGLRGPLDRPLPDARRDRLGARDEAELAAIGIDLGVAQRRVAGAVLEIGDPRRGALRLDQRGDIGVGALDGQVRSVLPTDRLVVGLDLPDVERAVDLVARRDVVADARVADDALQLGDERRARTRRAGEVADLLEAQVEDVERCADRAVRGRRKRAR